MRTGDIRPCIRRPLITDEEIEEESLPIVVGSFYIEEAENRIVLLRLLDHTPSGFSLRTGSYRIHPKLPSFSSAEFGIGDDG